MSNLKNIVKNICINAKKASNNQLAIDIRNKILLDVSRSIKLHSQEIIEANNLDLEYAYKNNLGSAKIDRLTLNSARIDAIANSLIEISNLEDPLGKTLYEARRDNGLHIKRVSTPIGVILAIFESRPNVAIDIAALCFKSGNAVILRSGSDCMNSAKTLIKIFQQSLEKFSLDQNMVSIISDSHRDYVKYLLKMDDFIDVVVPRGGKSLIKAVMKSSKIPVFKHLEGNCHTYIHEDADIEKSRKISVNAKLRRVGICGATESLIIDKKIAKNILPLLAHDFYVNGCEMRGDKHSIKIDSRIKLAKKSDYYTEYLDKIISIKIVENIDQAILHINNFSSSHTESIISENMEAVNKFFSKINSAIVMHNASTQFADGGEFGLGAEVGISTGKLHARGPVGLEQLTTYKYLVDANCALRK